MNEQSQNNLSQKFRLQDDASTNSRQAWVGDKAANQAISYYGIETGNRFVKRFKLLFASGKSVSIPYAYLPVIILTEEKQLQICTHDVQIRIMGRNLGKIQDWLNEEKILWLKESNTDIDPGDSDVFISSIKIEGEWLR